MDEKINLKAIEQYSEIFSNKVLDTFFERKDVITGPEILQLSSIRQVNLFIIFELFNAWKEENKRNRSPYFDYAATPVKEAMEALMSALSNHIAVDRATFSPLLRRAAYNTLLLILDPYDFFADLIEGRREQITIESFNEQLKYLKINRAPLERLLQKLEEKNLSPLSNNEAFAMLDTILEEVNFTPEDVDDHLKKFQEVVPLSIDQFYESKPLTISEVKSTTVSLEESKTVIRSDTQPIHEHRPKSTVNERLAQESRPTLADNFKRIGRIKDSLTINQKFMFTKVLFHGDFELFSKAIDDLDRQDNIKGALRYLEQNYEEWDRESEEFHEFMELVEKRFG